MITPLLKSSLPLSTLLLIAGLLSSLASAADPAPAIKSPAEAAKVESFKIQGEYVSSSESNGPKKGIQVIALGDDEFRAVIFNGGLPGAGWDGSKKQEIEGNSDDMLDLTDGMDKANRQSNTMGLKPPKGATVLFDGTQETFEKAWQEGAQVEQIGDELLLQEGATSVDQFQDYVLHLEFRLPYMPTARGQGRANSGIYHQGRYETQILDSFGLEGKDNECGGLYKIKTPDLNMCLPPLAWQTYDVTITAARYDDEGKKIENARLTALLNGVIIHDDIELPNATAGNRLKETPEPGPIFLQNHSNPVRFRNIWVLPRDAEQHSKRPIVPSFERFHARASEADPAGGRLLMGELNCTACHAASPELKAQLNSKPAPKLDNVGARIHPEYLEKFVLQPHGEKPGSTMPTMLSGLSEAERLEALEPIVHFLASTGRVKLQAIDAGEVAKGDRLFHSVGCTICHAPQNGDPAPSATSVPLGPLEKKYTIASLTSFLQNPHAIRAGGRMPNMHLDKDEAGQVAHYLLRGADVELGEPNVHFQAYHGRWDELPDFNQLKPVKKGQTNGFNLLPSGKTDQFGMVYTGWFDVPEDGIYEFFAGSDDGSRILVDGSQVVINDGIHGYEVKSGEKELAAGPHEFRLEYFEKAGFEVLSAEIAGPKIPRQDLAFLLRLTKEKPEASPENAAAEELVFRLDRSKVDLGREQFANVGCANCHEMKASGKPIAATVKARPLAEVNPQQGCLAENVPAGLPNYDLSREQRAAIQAALTTSPEQPTPQQQLASVMSTFNCYACHERGGKGGAELARNALFKASIPEMGDEGRLPPPLNGVADKLQESWLRHVLHNGARDRTYMKVRMPKFSHPAVDGLTQVLVELDQKTEAETPELTEPELRVKAIGQQLVSGNKLACIKCHTFADYPATGIQAISLTTMHKRLRKDWFQRYLADPQKYRPGTRMPNSFPNGVSAARDILHGHPGEQIEAMWTYLQDGNKAGIPAGLLPDPIELIPEETPVIYRNFVEGVSARAIAVGYPEHVNIGWDAEELCLKVAWHGRFIDASMHWRGRGRGNQRPLGIHVVKIESNVPWAVAGEAEKAWPTEAAQERGFQLEGYELDEAGRPVFRYSHPQAKFREQILPLPESDEEADLKRIFEVESVSGSVPLQFLVAAGRNVEIAADGVVVVDGTVRHQLDQVNSADDFRVLENDGVKYVIFSLDPAKSSRLVQTIRW